MITSRVRGQGFCCICLGKTLCSLLSSQGSCRGAPVRAPRGFLWSRSSFSRPTKAPLFVREQLSVEIVQVSLPLYLSFCFFCCKGSYAVFRASVAVFFSRRTVAVNPRAIIGGAQTPQLKLGRSGWEAVLIPGVHAPTVSGRVWVCMVPASYQTTRVPNPPGNSNCLFRSNRFRHRQLLERPFPGIH